MSWKSLKKFFVGWARKCSYLIRFFRKKLTYLFINFIHFFAYIYLVTQKHLSNLKLTALQVKLSLFVFVSKQFASLRQLKTFFLEKATVLGYFWINLFSDKRNFFICLFTCTIILLATPFCFIRRSCKLLKKETSLIQEDTTKYCYTSLIETRLDPETISIDQQNNLLLKGFLTFSFNKGTECLDLIDQFDFFGQSKTISKHKGIVNPKPQQTSITYPVELLSAPEYLGSFFLFNFYRYNLLLSNRMFVTNASKFTAQQNSFIQDQQLSQHNIFCHGIEKTNKYKSIYLSNYPTINFYIQSFKLSLAGLFFYCIFILLLILCCCSPMIDISNALFFQISAIWGLINIILFLLSSKSLGFALNLLLYQTILLPTYLLVLWSKKESYSIPFYSKLSLSILLLTVIHYLVWFLLVQMGLQFYFF